LEAETQEDTATAHRNENRTKRKIIDIIKITLKAWLYFYLQIPEA